MISQLTKNIEKIKYKYSGYGRGLGRFGTFPLLNSSEFGKNVVFFWVDMCILITKEKKDILTFREGPTQGLNDATFTEEKSISPILLSMTKNSA